MSNICRNCMKSHKETNEFCKPCQAVIGSQRKRNKARIAASK